MGPLRRAAARGGRALMMVAMAPVASTSNVVATGGFSEDMIPTVSCAVQLLMNG